VGELVVRAVLEFGPDEGRALLEAADWRRWRVQLDPRRLEVEPLTGLARRKAATVVVRDVERNLGRVRPHPQWRRALEELLGNVASASAESVAR
jgi:hypothetical protein